MTSGTITDGTAEFEAARPRLLGLAYRMLGVYAAAEDVVQEAWLRWRAVDLATIDRPEAWLTTVTTRLALDRLRADRRRREDYVGPWIPEPIVVEPGPEDSAELADSLTLGFLTMLDQLSPVERAVLLLAEVFAVPYVEVAETVGKSEVACRQIASRARRRLRAARHGAGSDAGTRRRPGGDRAVVDAFLASIALGDVDRCLQLLSPDVVCLSDGGPHRRAARRPVVGPHRVARLFANLGRRMPAGAEVRAATINGDVGFVLRVDDEIDFAAAFEVEDDRVVAIWVVRNPEKLEHLAAPVPLR